MLILGLDLSLSSTGFNIITDDKSLLAYGTFQTDSKKMDEFHRIHYIVNEIEKLIVDKQIDVIVCENQFFGGNARTGLTLSKLLGAVIYICIKHDRQIELLTPTQARKLLMDNGKAKKEEVAEYIRKEYEDIGEYSDKERKTKGIKKTSDIYDSMAVSFAWLKRYNLNNKYKKG